MSLAIMNMLKISINIYYTKPWRGGGICPKYILGPQLSNSCKNSSKFEEGWECYYIINIVLKESRSNGYILIGRSKLVLGTYEQLELPEVLR